MSTYAIANAIEMFANNFREVVREKNKIEKEKLEFEKEKFEFNKQQLKSTSNTLNNKHEVCNHNWKYDSTKSFPTDMVNVKQYICTYCEETKTEEEPMITTT